MCIKFILLKSFLTFILWTSGIRSVVGKCISLLFKVMQVSPHFICNTSHIQFFFTVTSCNDSSPISLNRCAYFWLIDSSLVRHRILYQPKTALLSPSWKRADLKRVYFSLFFSVVVTLLWLGLGSLRFLVILNCSFELVYLYWGLPQL